MLTTNPIQPENQAEDRSEHSLIPTKPNYQGLIIGIAVGLFIIFYGAGHINQLGTGIMAWIILI